MSTYPAKAGATGPFTPIPAPAKTAPKPWYSVGYLNHQGNPYWIVCRDRFAGRDYMETPAGKRRRFLSAKAADAAIAAAAQGDAS